MKKMLLSFGILLVAAFPSSLSAQILNTNAPSQACQCDSLTVTFSIGAQPFNLGNTVRVEMSEISNGAFNGNFIEIAPLTVPNTGNYSIEAIVPCTTVQGAYAIRLVTSDPITQGDTIDNIIVGKLPPVDSGIDIDGAYFSNAFGDWRFCQGDTVILRAPDPAPGESYQYRWYQGGGMMPGQSGSGIDTLVVTSTGNYSLRLRLGLCEAYTDQYTINEYLPPTTITPQQTSGVVISPDTIRFCYGTIGLLDAPAPPAGVTYQYQWFSDSVNLSGQTVLYPLIGDTLRTLEVDTTMRVYVSVNDSFCTDTSAIYWVIADTTPESPVVNVPWPGFGSASLDICINDSTLLSATDSVASWGYQWEYFTVGSWSPIPGAVNPWLQVDTALVPDTTRFRLVISNQTCEWVSDTITVNIVPLPIISLNITADTIGLCPGDSVMVVAQGNSSSYSWTWNMGPGSTPGSFIYVNSPGTYYVTGTGANGCQSVDSITVVFFFPTADAGPDQTTNPDSTVQLAGSGGVTYYWYANKPVFFSNPFSPSPFTIASNKPDTVTYYLVIVGANGCTDIDSMQVFVVPLEEEDDGTLDWEILDRVPNFISPNDDGFNDALILSEVMNGDVCKVTIINRWGAEVYSTEDYQNNWAGTDNGGSELPDGAYFVILECDNSIRYKGSVTIMRNN